MTSKKVDLKPLRNAVLQIEKILQELVETGDRMQVDDFMRAKKTCFIEAKRVSLDIASQSTNKGIVTAFLYQIPTNSIHQILKLFCSRSATNIMNCTPILPPF